MLFYPYKNESNATILILNTIQNVDVIISLFSQKFVYFLQETGVNIYVLFLLRKKKPYLVILSDHFYIKFM